jgi:hypothetical protein
VVQLEDELDGTEIDDKHQLEVIVILVPLDEIDEIDEIHDAEHHLLQQQ